MKDGGPAFPYSALQPDPETRQLVGSIYADNVGMSLRDWFAGMALQGLLSDDSNDPACISEDVEREQQVYAETCAQSAYRYSDAMLKAREKS